jgi:hypothetical protein
MAKYSGHRSWNAWNVSLWINHDESLYRFALDTLRRYKSRRVAARRLAEELHGQRTPDGAVYNRTCLYEALKGMDP